MFQQNPRTMLNFTSWIHEALFEYSTMLHGLYRNALLEKKKKHKEKKPAVYVVRLINDLLAVYTKTAVAKLVAYQSKRQEEDSLGWEDSIRLIKPSTSGGPRPGTRGESAVAKITAKMGTDTGTGASSSSLSATVHFQKDSVALSSTSTASKPTESDSAPPLPPPPGMLPDILKRSASASRGGEVRSRNNGRQRKVVEQVKPKTEEEVLTECFAVLASQLALLMSQKMRNPAEMCRVSLS